MHAGKIISFEGITCVGKTEVIKGFEKYLKERHIKFISKLDLTEFTGLAIQTGRPTDELGKDIMKILNSYADDPFFRFGYPLVETFLILAKRAFEAKSRLLPKLEDGYFVICDRDIDTVCAYQLVSILNECPAANITEILKTIRFLTGLSISLPSLTFYLTATIGICDKRFKADSKRSGILTEEHKKFLRKALKYYENCFQLPIAERELIRINAKKSKESVLNEVIIKFEQWQQKI